MKLPNLRIDLRVALLYAAFGGLWILFSDRLLAAFTSDIDTLSRLQTYKGWAFVAASAVLIFTLLRYELELRKRAEGDFQESEERYRLLFENSLDAILLCAPEEGRILSANPAACRMFGQSEAELVQQGLTGLTRVTLPHHQATWQHRLQSGDLHEELTLSRRGGSAFLAEVSTTSFKDKKGQARTSLIIRDVARRRQAEQALWESEKRYRLISENSADVIWTLHLATGRFTYVSPSVFHLRGLTPEEVMAQPMEAALTPASYRFIAQNLPARLAAFEAGDPLARTAITEVDQPRKDGSIVPTEVVTTLLTDAEGQVVEVLGVTRDISERKEAEAQIQRQLGHLNSLHIVDLAISSSFDLGVVFDVVLGQLTTHLGVDAAVILLFNPQLQIVEYAASRGLSPEALEAVKGSPGHGRARRVLLERRTLHQHVRLPREREPGGALQLANETFADYFGAPLIAKGEVKGVLEVYQRCPRAGGPDWMQFLEMLAGQAAIAIDNAQLFSSLQRAKISLEGRVAERTAELHQANLELAHASQAKDEFLATMSHELRTPLNSILGLSESLLEFTHGPLNDHQQRYVSTIEASARHLADVISDILDLSKIEAGKIDFLPQRVSVDELCRSSLAFITSQVARKAISVTYQNESAVAHLTADPRRLKQILINLLTNAVKFTPAHGHVILRVGTDVENNRICFSVIDDGIGIAPADLHKLFKPFVQLDGSLNREHGGTGLGLALVQKLADLHGGSVALESNGIPGQGSRFTVYLPLEMDIMDMPAVAAPIERHDRTERRAPHSEIHACGKVLIVEDHAPNLLLLSEYLGRSGYEVMAAQDGAAAIERAQASQPDLIVMDIQLPVMDGLETMARLRKDPRFTSTPIIALTALAMSGDRERCLNAGANEYLSKPVSLKTLSETIEKLLRKP